MVCLIPDCGPGGMTAILGLEGDSGPHALHGDLSPTAPQSSNTEAYTEIVYYQMSSFFYNKLDKYLPLVS
jgi:hypothetical protein